MAVESHPTPTEGGNVAVCRRFVEDFVNTGEVDAAADTVAEDVVVHQLGAGVEHRGRDELLSFVQGFRHAVPDWTLTVVDVVDGGERVVFHLRATGTPDRPWERMVPTGKSFDIDAVYSFRLEDDRIAEIWMLANAMSLARQLGVVPPTLGGILSLVFYRLAGRVQSIRPYRRGVD